MKSLGLLKTLLDLFLFITVFCAIAVIVAVPIKLMNPQMKLPVSIDGVKVIGTDWLSIVFVVLTAIAAFFFVYAIFLLRQVIVLFSKREIFSDNVIRKFRIIGKCIVAAGLFRPVSMFFYDMFQNNNAEIQFGSGGFDSLLLSVSLGLLFIVIGEIFQHAKNLKEENELTV